MVRTGSFISRNILQWGLCAAMFTGLWLVGFGNVYTFLTLLLTSFGNEIHRWNHMARTGKFVTFMKDTGLIQAHKQHSMHHKPPHKKYYCVMTSLVNAVLEPIGFWRKLEWLVQATTGITPKTEQRRDSKPAKEKQPAKPSLVQTTESKAAKKSKASKASPCKKCKVKCSKRLSHAQA